MAQAQEEKPANELTIDELAQRTGMTVRNIRAHQSRGLLPPPEVRARTGYYGGEHVARIKLIQQLQEDGYNLKAIQNLVEASNGAGQEALDFRRTLLTSFREEEPELTTLEELEARLGGPFDQKTLRKAEKLGLIRPLGDDRFEVPSPTLLSAGEQLIGLGIPLNHALAVGERINRHSQAIADAFVRLFAQDVIGDSADPTKRSPEEWERLKRAFERLRPLASAAVQAGFQQTMSRAVDRAVERELERTLKRR
jgi:DNA-binding transcriptional MerR regulator